MSPYERMCEEYLAHPQAAPFQQYVAWFLQHGFVFSTPEYFVMGRAVNSENFDPDAIEFRAYSRQESDAWYLFAVAGQMPKLWEVMPWPLPKIGWERVRAGKRELSFFRTEDLHRLCPPYETSPSSPA